MKKGSTLSIENKEKISETLKSKGIRPPSQKGLKNFDVSISNRNRFISIQTREKHSKSLKEQWADSFVGNNYC